MYKKVIPILLNSFYCILMVIFSQYFSCFISPFSAYQIYDICTPIFNYSSLDSHFIIEQRIKTGNYFSYLEYPTYSSMIREINLNHNTKEIYPYSLFLSSNTSFLYIPEVSNEPISVISASELNIFYSDDLTKNELIYGDKILTNSNSICIPLSYANKLLVKMNCNSVDELIGKELTIVNKYFSSLNEKKFVITSILEPKENCYYSQISKSIRTEAPIVTLGDSFNVETAFASIVYKKSKPVIIDFVSKLLSYSKTNQSSFLNQTNSYMYFKIFDNYTPLEEIDIINSNLQDLSVFLTKDNSLFMALCGIGFIFILFSFCFCSLRYIKFFKHNTLNFIICFIVVFLLSTKVLSFITGIPIYGLNVPFISWIGFIVYLIFGVFSSIFLLIVSKRKDKQTC